METGVCLHRGLFGEPGERDPFTGNFEKWLKEGSGNGAFLSVGSSLGEVSKGREVGVCLYRGHTFVGHGGTFFP